MIKKHFTHFGNLFIDSSLIMIKTSKKKSNFNNNLGPLDGMLLAILYSPVSLFGRSYSITHFGCIHIRV